MSTRGWGWVRARFFAVWLAALLVPLLVPLLAPRGAAADPLSPADVPAELKPWIPWALAGVGEEACPAVGDVHVCAWLGKLFVATGRTGASFKLDVTVEPVFVQRRARVPLPGTAELWPIDVRVGETRAVVLDAGEGPYVSLPPGEHVIEGRFAWRAAPELLAVPSSVARVLLEAEGKAPKQARRNDDGGVWLEGAAAAPEAPTGQPEQLEIVAMRRIDDGVPLIVTTRLELSVGGSPRELSLPPPLLPGGELLSLEAGELPARWGSDGTLVLGLRSGKHTVIIVERHSQPPEELALAARSAPWPGSEVWVWAPQDLRQVEASGGSPIDPAQTNLPAEWRSLSAFQLRAPTTFTMKTVRRGQAEPPPNDVHVSRRLWLDLDGDGFTVVDSLRGSMYRDWRLTFSGAGELGHVRANGTDQLITVDGQAGGVELRSAMLAVDAESRAASGVPRELAAVGWASDAQELNIELNLPPGWELLHASGVDEITPSWLMRWQVLDVVLLLVVAAAVGRVAGWKWAPAAALALALTHASAGSTAWAWLALAAVAALLRARRSERLTNALRAAWFASAAVLVFMLIGGTAEALRAVMVPHALAESQRELDELAAETQAVPEYDGREGGTGTRARGEEGIMGKVSSKYESKKDGWGIDDAQPLRQAQQAQAQQDPGSVVQTGPGVPMWSFGRWHLHWVGPVDKAHALRLWLISPTESALLTLLGVALAGAVAFVLLRASARAADMRGSDTRGTGAAVLALAVLFAPGVARAEPAKELIDELRSRLTAPPDCAPSCSSVARIVLRAADRELEVTAEVHVAALSSYRLPGPAASWIPASVLVDGEPSNALVLLDGHLHLRLGPGTHEVKLSGPIAGDDLTLALGADAHSVVVDARGWNSEGVDDEGHAESVHFFREGATDGGGAQPTPGAKPAEITVPPWLEVSRTLEAGVSWTMQTVIKRVSAKGAPIVVRLPLLPGEKVTDAAFKEEKGELVINLDRDAVEAHFSSSLEPRDALELHAAVDRPWSEQWTLRCSPVWRCAHDGLVPRKHDQNGLWEPVFRPWPGESVKVSFVRPAAAPGRSVTVHAAQLVLSPGERVQGANLNLDLHTSVGGVHPLRLPPGVRITRLLVDGGDQPAQLDGDTLPVTLTPGRHHITVEWQEPGGAGLLISAPHVIVGDSAANTRVSLELPADRWPVFIGGPAWGAKITLWGYMLLLGAIGIALGSLPRSPLRRWQWALLAMGLTQLSPIGAAIVAAWFFLVVYRKSWPALHPRLRNAGQIALAAVTLAFIGCVVFCAYNGITQTPDMMIVHPPDQGSLLSWYIDQSDGTLPRPWIISTSPWVWRIAMAAWSTWVAFLLWRWLRTAWDHWTEGGIWLQPPPPAPPPAAPPPAQT